MPARQSIAPLALTLVVVTTAVVLTPLTAQVSMTPSEAELGPYSVYTGPFTLSISVTNDNGAFVWPQSAAYSFSCFDVVGVTITSVQPTTFSLSYQESIEVIVTYTTSGVSGHFQCSVGMTNPPTGDQASAYYNVSLNNDGPIVSTWPTNGEYWDVTKCVMNCFDAVAFYATAPYVSADMARSVQLVYRGAQAHSMGVVQIDAVDTSSINPVKMSLQLYTSQGSLVTFTNYSTEIFYAWTSHPATGNVNRLAAQFDASTWATGVYNFTAVVRSYRAGGSFRESNVPVRVLIANEAGSPFGAGWMIAGFQRAYVQADGSLVITEGNGSIAYFAPGTTSCFQGLCMTSYFSPSGDYTTLTKKTGGTCSNPPCPTYLRAYPAGSTIGFDATGKMLAMGGYLLFSKDARFANSMAEVRRRPWSLTYVSKATFGYSGNLLVSITDSTGKAYTLGYDGSNHLRWIKDPGGRVDSITIDASNNLTRIKDWATTNGQGGKPLEYQYDAFHRLMRWADRRGATWGLSYDFAGKVASDTAPQVRANGQLFRPVVRFASPEQLVLINPASGQGTSSNPGPNVDTAVVRGTVTNARGYTTTFALNRFGAATLVQEPLGRTSSFTLNSHSAVLRSASPSGHVVKYTWNGSDLLQVLDSTTGRTINMTYTSHRLATVSGDIDSVVNYWTVNATSATLDSTRVGGSGTTRFTYGADGRMCRVVDPGGHASQCFFTSTGGFQNTDSIQYALGTVGYRYNGHGQNLMTINQVKDTVTTVYDSLGRVVATIGAVHDTTRFFYDDSLRLTRVQDAKGQTYRTWFNALGWADSTADPAGQKDRYEYDLNGNRLSWTNRNGRTITSVYDSLDHARSTIADGKTTTFFADPAGRFVASTNGESIDTLRIDVANRPSVAISCRVLVNGNAPQCFRDSTAYEIRDMVTLTALSAPGIWGTTKFEVGYHYNMYQQLDVMTPGHLNSQPAQSISFQYSAEAMDSIRTFGALNNLTLTRSYPWNHRTDQSQFNDPALNATLGSAANFDNAGRLATRFHGSLANPDTARSFNYGRQGNLVQYADTLHHYTQQCQFYWFTGGYYCTSVDQPTFLGSTSYAYDSVGNRKDPAGLIALDAGNRLRRWQNLRMDYDLAGNMIARRTLNPADTTQLLRRDSLFWSALGNLDSVRTRDGSGALIGRVVLGYDGWGRRVRKSSASGTTRYIWDGQSMLAQLDTLGNLVAGYTYYGLDEIASVLRRDRADSSYYYVQDYSQNVVALLARTASGNVIDNQYRYEPFGTLQGSGSNPIPNSLQFAGREYDAETQLYYNRARYLDPTLGRFVSEDPIGLGGGINLYAYVGNDPVNRSDPSGTSCKDFTLRQELFSDKAIHFLIGLWLTKRWWPVSVRPFTWFFKDDSPWGAVHQSWEIGLLHEGPWHIPIYGRFEIGDGDFTDAKGAPCTGWFDTAWFMLVPLINYVAQEGWPWHPTEDMLGGGNPPWWDSHIRVPGYAVPSTMPPGYPGMPVGWPTL